MPIQDQADQVPTPSHREDVTFLLLSTLVVGFVFLVLLQPAYTLHSDANAAASTQAPIKSTDAISPPNHLVLGRRTLP